MKRLSADSDGMIEMPMRLLLATTITALVLPVFWSGYQDLSLKRAENSVALEVEGLMVTIQSVMDGGSGSYQEVELSLDIPGTVVLGDFIAGGPVEGDESWTSFTVRYRFGGEGWAVVAPDPPIRMTSENLDSGLEIPEGTIKIYVRHDNVDGEHVAILGLCQ